MNNWKGHIVLKVKSLKSSKGGSATVLLKET